MGSNTDERLTGDRVKELRAEFAKRFASDTVLAETIDGVIGSIDQGWIEHSQGMETSSFDKLNQTLGPAISGLLSVKTAAEAKHACEELVHGWRAIRKDIEWVG